MSNTAPQESVRDKLGAIYTAAHAEFGEVPTRGRAALIASMGGLAFEWGTGNEALIGTISGHIHTLTHNSLVTGLATGSASFAEQGTIGLMMAATVGYFPRVASAVRQAVSRGDCDGESQQPSKKSRVLQMLALGSAVSVAKENTTQQHTGAENVKYVLGSAAVIGAANLAIVTTASEILTLGADHGFEHQADMIVSVVSNPMTYVGLFAASLAYRKLRNSRRQVAPIESTAVQQMSEGELPEGQGI